MGMCMCMCLCVYIYTYICYVMLCYLILCYVMVCMFIYICICIYKHTYVCIYTYTYILTFFLAYTLTFFMAYMLTFFLAFYLASILSFSLTWALPDLNSDIWRSRLKSGSAHRYLELAVKEATLIKSRDPHLAGGGKKSNRLVVSKLPIVDFMPTWFGDFLGVEWSQPGCHCIYGI